MITTLCAVFAILLSSFYMACVGLTLLEQQAEEMKRDADKFPWHYTYISRPFTFILEVVWGSFMFTRHGLFCVFSEAYRTCIIEEIDLSEENNHER